MDTRRFLDLLTTAERLKNVTRHCYTSAGRHESVAEHCWMAMLMAFFMRDEFPEADMEKVMKMLLVHDIGEAFTGDVPAFNKTEAHEDREERLLDKWVASLPQPYSAELAELYQEMEELKTLEAKIYKSIDGLEAVVQHNLSDISTWIPLEYELNLTYAQERVGFSPWLTELREEMRRDTKAKIAAEKETKDESL